MRSDDIKTLAYVLRRTNYGEADRILNLITPNGKVSAIAKSVRKEKSKIAGSIEMFSLIEVTIHKGKSDMGVITSAKMHKFYSNIISDISRMELASLILRKISSMSEHSDSPEYFKIVDQTLSAINSKYDLGTIEAWFWLNYLKVSGEQVNLYRDTDGQKLDASKKYVWDFGDNSLREYASGDIGAEQIKLMRLMLTSGLATTLKVKDVNMFIPQILKIAKALNKI